MNAQEHHSPDAGIRKAAILVTALDRTSADAVLAALGPEPARRVRRAVVQLGEVDPQEQRRAVDEFFRLGTRVPPKPGNPAGIELDDRQAPRLLRPHSRLAADEPAVPLPNDTPPFRFLREAQGDKLAGVLCRERPQTIALVLSHLPPERAGNVLARLPGPVQAEVVRRLVDLEETDPEILREVERALELRLSQQVRMQRRRVAGMQAVTGILEAADSRVSMQILDNLATHDRALAERLGVRRLRFEELADLDDAELRSVFEAAGPELVMTALVGAEPSLIERILQHFPSAEAETVRRTLDHPGPIRLRDVEDARQQIADLTRRLAMEGRIQLPPAQPILVS